MSAFVVDKAHIDAMVAAGLESEYGNTLRWWFPDREVRQLTRLNADEVGAMLWSENVRSVDYRYSPPGREAIYGEGWETPDQDLPGRYVTATLPGFDVEVSAPEYLQPYTFSMPKRSYSPVEILKAISCFAYQSCETDDWRETEAFAFCEALQEDCIGRLPGMSDAPWGIS
jgi:hypothetical protein